MAFAVREVGEAIEQHELAAVGVEALDLLGLDAKFIGQQATAIADRLLQAVAGFVVEGHGVVLAVMVGASAFEHGHHARLQELAETLVERDQVQGMVLSGGGDPGFGNGVAGEIEPDAQNHEMCPFYAERDHADPRCVVGVILPRRSEQDGDIGRHCGFSRSSSASRMPDRVPGSGVRVEGGGSSPIRDALRHESGTSDRTSVCTADWTH